MDVKQKIVDILVDKLGIAPTEVTPEANLIKDLGIDSLDFAELIMEFEQEFNIKIPDNDAEQLQTVSEIVDYVTRMLKKEGNSTSAL